MKIKKFKDWKIFSKIINIFILNILIISSFIIFYYIPMFKKGLINEKRTATKNVVEVAYSLVNQYYKSINTKRFPSWVAKKQALEKIKNLRFQQDQYFWINDLYPKMIMHPFKPKLNGKDISNLKDPNGKKLFFEMAEISKRKGGGFVDYMWPKPGFTKPVQKVSYVKLFKPWGWVIGNGIYIDDIEKEVSKTALTIITSLIIITLIMFFLVFFISRFITKPINPLMDMAKELSNGNLAHKKIKIKSNDELGTLSLSFNHLTDTLNDIIHQVNLAVEQVSTGAGQVSSSSQSLSSGAAEQASSLEQVTASATEINSQAKQNSESAIEAKSLAEKAKKITENGNEQMKLLVTGMEDINKSSEKIKKVINVIDDIAFQTNLLALNANVEAARAGKYGKGFGVVAEEVRNLAVRSANYVKETTHLIEQTIQKIENGNNLVKLTAEQLNEIRNAILKVSDLVIEIAAASKEQSQGLDQVNTGLNQIEQVTQINSASAEEGASAAEELAAQAAYLKEIVEKFKLRKMETPNVKKVNETISPELLKIIEIEVEKRLAQKKHVEYTKNNKNLKMETQSKIVPNDIIKLEDDNFEDF